jgi:hypothetical protein
VGSYSSSSSSSSSSYTHFKGAKSLDLDHLDHIDIEEADEEDQRWCTMKLLYISRRPMRRIEGGALWIYYASILICTIADTHMHHSIRSHVP